MTETIQNPAVKSLQHEVAEVRLEEGEREVGKKITIEAVDYPAIKALSDGEDMEDSGEDMEDITSALNACKDLVKKSSEQTQRIEDKLAFLSQKVNDSIKETASLKQSADELDLRIEHMRETREKSLKTLQKQVNDLDKRWEDLMGKTKLESDGLLGDLCLTAIYVERALCSYTFPEVFKKDADEGNLHDLMNFLNNDDQLVPLDPSKYNCEKVLQEAKERWAVVCKNFNFPDEWKTKTGEWEISDCSVPSDIRAIEVLKARLGGLCVIEKPIKLKHAREILEDMRYEMYPWQFDLVAGFIGSLRENMTKIGLHHDNILLD